MGFPFLHKYVFPEDVFVQATASNINQLNKIEKIRSVFFDCTGLIYRLSYSIRTENLSPDILAEKLQENIYYYLNIINMFPCIINKGLFDINLIFDGRPPKEKIVLHRIRERKNKVHVDNCLLRGKPLMGLSAILNRNERSEIIAKVSEHNFKFLDSFLLNTNNGESYNTNYENVRSGVSNRVVISSPKEPGEADIKIIKRLLSSSKDNNEYFVIVTCDTDIFISLDSIKEYNILIILWLPHTGQHYLLTDSLNIWLNNNSIVYNNLLVYLLFFCGSDYETAIISGTRLQITKIFEFAKERNFQVTIDNLLLCWSLLTVKRSGKVIISGLTLNKLKTIVYLKIQSTYQSIMYYGFGKPPSVACLITNYDWQLLVQNILPRQIKPFLDI